MFLSDKYHLIHYGRLITDDTFLSNSLGIHGNLTYKTLTERSSHLEKVFHQNEYLKSGLYLSIKEPTITYDMLSLSDTIAMTAVINEYGKVSMRNLGDIIKTFPEWKGTGVSPVNTIELFTSPNEFFNYPDLQNAIDIYSGRF